MSSLQLGLLTAEVAAKELRQKDATIGKLTGP